MNITGHATFGGDGAYRYRLSRAWAPGPWLTFVMLNPSKADALKNDATVARCIRRAMDGGFGAVHVVNLFALRTTYPKELVAYQGDPVGPENDAVILGEARAAGQVICAWGSHPFAAARAKHVLTMLQGSKIPLYCLRLTANGSPQHPLHLAYSVKPIPFT